MTPFLNLPHPTKNAMEQSEALTKIIALAIKQANTPLPFADFMNMALYYPQLGYYQSPDRTLGKTGDFTTAPQISPLFAHCIGRQAIQVFEQTGCANFLELGPGTGQFAADLIDYLASKQALPDHYYLYEISESLKKQQHTLLQARCPDYLSRIHWLDHLPTDFKGMIFGNEMLDAMPVHRFMVRSTGIKEACVTWDGSQFQWIDEAPKEPLSRLLQDLCDRHHLPEGYASELNLSASDFIQSLTDHLHTGLILLADYGYGEALYYHPERNRGTLTCFYRHLKHENPLLWPGLQDITAHIDFTRIAEAAVQAEGSILGYTTQANFLLASGLLDIAKQAEAHLNSVETFQLHQAIKLLTMPTEMGETIKFMGIGKHLSSPLLGFQWQDRRREL